MTANKDVKKFSVRAIDSHSPFVIAESHELYSHITLKISYTNRTTTNNLGRKK